MSGVAAGYLLGVACTLVTVAVTWWIAERTSR